MAAKNGLGLQCVFPASQNCPHLFVTSSKEPKWYRSTPKIALRFTESASSAVRSDTHVATNSAAISNFRRILVGVNTASTTRILLVEDDSDLAQMVAEFLESSDFSVQIEPRGDTAITRIIDENPDAVILDVNLPGVNGFEVCRSVRDEYPGLILILTARGDELDEIVGLEIGADDYMSKPVRPRVLLARLRSHLRKTQPDVTEDGASIISVSGLVVNSRRRTVEVDGQEVDLTTAEFDLLWMLAEKSGTVVGRDDIYPKLVGIQYDGQDRSIDLRVSRLRKKIGDDPTNPTRVKSVRGVGYILVADK